MRIATAAAVASLAAGIALTAPANAAIVEGKIMWLGAQEPSVTINKKTYRVSESTKVIVSGKPGNYQSLKPGMTCKANVANGAQTTSLICTGKGRNPLPNPLPISNDPVTRPATGPAGQSAGGSSAGGGSSGATGAAR